MSAEDGGQPQNAENTSEESAEQAQPTEPEPSAQEVDQSASTPVPEQPPEPVEPTEQGAADDAVAPEQGTEKSGDEVANDGPEDAKPEDATGEGASGQEEASVEGEVPAPGEVVASEETASGEAAEEEEEEALPEEKVLELEDGIAWFQRRIEMYIPEMKELDEACKQGVSEFLTDAQVDTIFVFLEEQDERAKPRVQRAAPLMENVQGQALYFFTDVDNRSDWKGVEDLVGTVFYGTVGKNAADSLTKLVGNLFMPEIRGNKAWPASLTKDLVGSVERFMGNMTDMANLAAGKTVLYVPQDNLDDEVECANDKDLVQRLESSVIHWTRQIKAVVNSQEGGQGQELVDDASPLAEISFWRSRSEDLSGIEEQIKAPALQRVVAVLQQAKSSYLESFLKLAEHIEAKTEEARDNHRMLSPLQAPCSQLLKSSLHEMPSLLEEVMCLARAIWACSKHLTSAESITGLLRKVSNSVISRCRAHVPIQEVMTGDIDKSVEVLRKSIHCGDVWKALFHTHSRIIAYQAAQASPAASPNGQLQLKRPASEDGEEVRRESGLWDYDESRIFAQMDAFMQRCRDLLEVCEWRAQFSYKLACDFPDPTTSKAAERKKDDAEEEAADEEAAEDDDEEEGKAKKMEVLESRPPAFGGSRAKETYSQLQAIREAFGRHMEGLEKLKYDPMDVKAPGWHEDFNRLKMEVKDLEVVLTNVIASAFNTVTSTWMAFDLEEAFNDIATRESVKRVVDKKTQELVGMFAEDLNWVRKEFDRYRNHPPLKPTQPRYAGAAAWAKMLLNRVDRQAEMLKGCYSVASTHDWSQPGGVAEQLGQVEHSIKEYMTKCYNDWQEHLQSVFEGHRSGGLMDNTLLTREATTQLLRVNFDPELLRLFREVEAWERVGFSIPFIAMENSKDKDYISGDPKKGPGINTIRFHVRSVVADYNRIITALAPWERKLYAEKLKALDRRFSPAVSKMTWSTKGIQDYFCKDARKHCHAVQLMVDDFKAHKERIFSNCQDLGDLSLINIEPKRLYGEGEFEEAQGKHRTAMQERLERLHGDIRRTLKDMFKMFLLDGAESLREWDKFASRVDKMVQEALSAAVRKSLQELARAINGDKRTEPQQLFRLRVVLDSSSRVAFAPSLKQLSDMINACSLAIISMLQVVPRLKLLVELEVRKEALKAEPDNQQLLKDIERNQAALDERVKREQLPSDQGGGDIAAVIGSEDEVIKVVMAIMTGMSANVGKMQKQMSYWEKFKHIWDYDKEGFIRRYAKNPRGVDDFEKDITRYRTHQKEVFQEESMSTLGFICIDCAGLKHDLIGHCVEWQRKFTGLLNEMARKELEAVLDGFESTTEKLSVVPTDLADLSKSVALLKQQNAELPAVQSQFEPIRDKYKLLEKFEVTVEEAELEQLNSLQGRYEQFTAFLSSTEKMLDKCKRTMRSDLERSAQSFEADSKTLADNFAQNAPTSCAALKTEAALHQLSVFQAQLEANRKTQAEIQDGMSIFEMNMQESESLQKLAHDIEQLRSLWEMKLEWEGLWDGYKLGKFKELQTDSMEETAGRFMKKVMLKKKECGSHSIWGEMKALVEQFRATMPLIQDLRNPALRGRHWIQLMDKVGSNFDYESDDFTLEKVIELELDKHSEYIGTISTSATKELMVEQAVQNVRDAWERLLIETVEYRDRGHYRIKTVEELYSSLDDNAVTLSALKGTRFAQPFMEEIVQWEKTLSHISEVLEMAQTVQKQWMYLENIFAGSEDIRRQLPAESTQFNTVDGNWLVVMRQFRESKTAKEACLEEGTLPLLTQMNTTLEKIQKSLDAYLETKRVAFPRFYFVSSDDLLEILGQARDPQAVQPHLKKCFDAIKKLKMEQQRKHWEASGMTSPEDEFVPFQMPVITDGPVEVWMVLVENAMRLTLRKLLDKTVTAFKNSKTKDKWVSEWPGQLLITSGQMHWTTECEKALTEAEKGNKKGMTTTKKKWVQMLNRYSDMVRGNISKMDRSKVVAVITIEVHARDVIDKLVKNGISSKTDFDWISQLRFYWDKDAENCVVHQISARFDYGCEYLGNCGRLVITPLTDRCYMTLTTALHLKRGGNPQGPAGTGKTETVKDLGKAIAKYVIVFNCSDGLDYKSMGRMFSGLAQTGAWSCFDEFNRIDIEVLSVVAQQILSILRSITLGLTEFNFEGRMIKLDGTCGIFVTMNPGYAGRTELPDNLKAILRPISMMVPDMALIAEIMLFSEGFATAKLLSKRLTGLFELMQQQMSKQDHYDYGLRNTKSILVAAGAMKRSDPKMQEDVLLYRTIRDMQMPKLIAEDVPLFNALNSDFFPGLEVSPPDYGDFQTAIENALVAKKLQKEAIIIKKMIQIYEVKLTRHGNMLVGQSCSGKSTAWMVLQDAMNELKKNGVGGYEAVKTFVINPKSLRDGELYGEYDLSTGEWLDGVLSRCMRDACAEDTPKQKWLVLDGPVDTLWIESMNTVLDDNKLLTLVSGERIAMPPQVSLLFEVQDLAVASPATVSRAGMVYFDPIDFTWKPYAETWLQTQATLQPYAGQLKELFSKWVDPMLDARRKECSEPVPCIEMNLVRSLCNLLDALCTADKGVSAEVSTEGTKLLEMWFIFALFWSIGGGLDGDSRAKLDLHAREIDPGLPAGQKSMHDWIVDTKKEEWVQWGDRISSSWRVAPDLPFYKILVPTVDTLRVGFVCSELMQANKHVLLVGDSGVGKSMIVQETVAKLPGALMVSSVNFSAQTSSKRLQAIIEGRVEKRMKDVFGPPGGKKMVMVIDDLNMPAKDTFGSQPPLELLRHWLDYGFWYDRQKQTVKFIKDIQLLQVMGYPGGGRSVITMRLQSRSNLVNVTFPAENQLKRIFSLPLSQRLAEFDDEVKGLCDNITAGTIDLYNQVCAELLPTPKKSHYLFNLRDLCKVLQGLLRATPKYYDSKASFLKLWVHECARVFHDRLIDDKDRQWFFSAMDSRLDEGFSTSIKTLFDGKSISSYGAFMSENPEQPVYEEYVDFESLKSFAEGKLEEYNYEPGYVAMQLVLFRDAIEHVCRLVRIVGMQRGNALLVGVGGSGRQSLTKLATYIADMKLFMIEITKQYRKTEFHEDLKKLYLQAGVERKETVFLFTDTQIVEESFLEDINGMLSTGEVPNLYAPDELGEIREGVKTLAREAGIEESNDSLYAFFIEQARNHMHVVLCFSPIGDSFRLRCRMFPGLVNCTSIDWFAEWPVEALREVALKFTEEVNLGTDEVKAAVTQVMATAHSSVATVSKRMEQELKRVNYVTPTNYLELVTGYLSLLAERRKKLQDLVAKYVGGVEKIEEAKKEVQEMSTVLEEKKVTVIKASKDTEDLLVVIVKEKAIADEQERQVSAEADKISQEEAATKIIADQAQADLDKALPALNAAAAALNSLNKNDINEIKAYSKPPPAVEMVLAAVLILRKASSIDWGEAKKHLSDLNFLKQLIDYDKDNMSDALLKKVDKYVNNPDFDADKIAKVSGAAAGMCKWVRAMSEYGSVSKTVAPKKEKLRQAMMSLEKKQAALRTAQASLKEVVDKVQGLQSQYDESIATKERLAKESATLEQKLERADQLVNGLSGERVRWEGSLEALHKDIENSVGDCVIAAAFLSYAGPFNSDYRQVLVKETWMPMVGKLQIPSSPNFDFALFLAEPTDVREWNLAGLPSDAFSTENGVLVTRGRRWPLMVDPQAQANNWIKKMEGEKGLKIVDPKMADWMRNMENAIQFGTPMLMEDMGEEVDPALEPVLSKSITKQGNRMVLRLGDKEVDYNQDFRFYLTTKLNNPHYPPEVSTKTTIVNFAIKREGLEEQLLGILVKRERPDLEERNQQLVVQVAKGKNQLQALEDKILHLLSSATGSLLDDDALVQTLQESKTISNEVTEQLRVAEETKVTIDQARESYRPSAFRASILYFVLNDMGSVDPMYQFSLDSYVNLFNHSISNSKLAEKIEERLRNLNDAHTKAVYENTCRGLFERHKLLFSMHMCSRILEGNSKLNKEEYTFLLRGGQALSKDSQAPNPAPEWLSESAWDSICELNKLQAFRDIDASFEQSGNAWHEWFTHPTPETHPLPGDWQSALNELQRLLVLRSIRPDRVVFASTSFIINNLGSTFVEPPPFVLETILDESNEKLPLIFILSPGVDPVNALTSLAEKRNMQDRLKTLALGQGQAPIANQLLADGRTAGHWVFLANCHLMLSWMNSLEKVVVSLRETPPHKDFRLWLSSYPHPKFPISILQAGTKMVTEPPKGLKANMARLYGSLSEAQFTRCQAGFKYRRLLFCLVFFHAVLVERKKFGTLGYNVPYDFNESDFAISEDCIAYYLDAYPTTPWDALRYLIAEANYGGRVTDQFDFRLVRCYTRSLFQDEALDADKVFNLAPPLEYLRIPDDGPSMRTFTDYIRGLPVLDHPRAFGQHPNADIAAQIADTNVMLDTLSALQPQTAGGGAGEGEDRILKVVRDLEENLPPRLDEGGIRHHKRDDPSALHVFLLQEVQRYNKLLRTMAASLSDVQKGIKGLVVMSAELDDVVNNLTLGRVPPAWGNCFPSLKPLASWTRDLAARISALEGWGAGDYPHVYWMSGFSYPTGFLTALLQTCARANSVSVDVLSWEFTVLEQEDEQGLQAPKDGAFIRGMFLEGARWDIDNGCLADQKPMELVASMPVVHFKPVEAKKKAAKGTYSCPCYMYPVRTGSRERPSYTISVDLKSGQFDPDYWIKQGTALLLSLAN